MMTSKPVIGFIGLGFMGHGMAANLRKGGHDLWVRGRRNRVPVESLLAMGGCDDACLPACNRSSPLGPPRSPTSGPLAAATR